MKKVIAIVLFFQILITSCTAPRGNRFVVVSETAYFAMYEKGAFDMCVSHALRDVELYTGLSRSNRLMISMTCGIEAKALAQEVLEQSLTIPMPEIPRAQERTHQF